MAIDFKDQIKQLGDRVGKLKELTATEEATKNAFIMPFIQILGYDVFNPLEVVPEFIADIGIKKGEKIDYAIFKDEVATILIECKHWAQNLNIHDGQLLRYFHVSKAKFGILTNGITYRFYSDLVEPNKMDDKPFLEFNINEVKDNQIEELKAFHKAGFDANNITKTARELKIGKEIREKFQNELNNPSDDFVRHFAKQINAGSVTAKVLEEFRPLTKKSLQNYISDVVADRLKSALSMEAEVRKEQEQPEPQRNDAEVQKVQTTEIELAAFEIVKAILAKNLSTERISYKDVQQYFAIILDNSSHKTICRLVLGNAKKYLQVPDSKKAFTKYEILSVEDLYQYAEKLLEVIDYIEGKQQKILPPDIDKDSENVGQS